MSKVERFSKEQFEAALPIHKDTGEPLWVSLGLVSGEYTYQIPINGSRIAIEVRSSVGRDGISAESGEDSIRAWLVDTVLGKPAGSKAATRWTTRLPGWESQLVDVVRTLYTWRMRAGDCPICQAPKGIYKTKRGKNKGRPFAKCWPCDSGFTWLDEEPKAPVFFSDHSQEQEADDGLTDPSVLDGGGDKGESRFCLVASTPDKSSDQDQSPPSSTSLFSKFGKKIELPDDDDDEEEEETPDIPITVDVSITRDRPAVRLDEYQQAVVDALSKGAQVIEACPGSGKTRTLENLVAALIQSGADPSRIGVFTFSNSAAAEARNRIALTLWPDIAEDELEFLTEPHEHKGEFSDEWLDADPARRMLVDWTCTIHALSFRLLTKVAGQKLRVLATGPNRWEADELIKDSLKEFDWKESLDSVQSYIGHAIRKLVVPAKAEEFYALMLAGTDVAWRASQLAEIFRRYYDFCKSRNLVDFNMMQARVTWLLQNDPLFTKRVQEHFDYILVDEAQDTSKQQAMILWTIAQGSGNIVFCGDVDQALYGFRGAHPSVLRSDFKDVWPEVTRFNLPINYRSTKAIINTAIRLIEHNYDGPEDPYLKPFGSRPDAPDGEPVQFLHSFLFNDLCEDVANLVIENPQDWFILSRTRAECAAIHLDLVRHGIPAINYSGGILFGAPHVRKVLAYARLACDYQNARDDLEILNEIANVASVEFKAPFTRRRHIKGCKNTQSWVDCGCPVIAEGDIDYSHTRFYGKKAVQDAGGWDGVLYQRDEVNRGGYPTTRAKGASDLVQFVHRIEKLANDAGACLNMIISDCILPWLAVEYNIEGEDPAENGKAEDFQLLLSMAEEGQSMAEYLDKVESLTQGDKQGDKTRSATIGTIHWSKGRESKGVIVNLTRCPIVPPTQQPGHLPMGKPPTIEEERRLAYVAVTRAKEECVVVSADEWNGLPVEESPFTWEMVVPPSLPNTKGEPQ